MYIALILSRWAGIKLNYMGALKKQTRVGEGKKIKIISKTDLAAADMRNGAD